MYAAGNGTSGWRVVIASGSRHGAAVDLPRFVLRVAMLFAELGKWQQAATYLELLVRVGVPAVDNEGSVKAYLDAFPARAWRVIKKHSNTYKQTHLYEQWRRDNGGAWAGFAWRSRAIRAAEIRVDKALKAPPNAPAAKAPAADAPAADAPEQTSRLAALKIAMSHLSKRAPTPEDQIAALKDEVAALKATVDGLVAKVAALEGKEEAV